MSKKDEFKDFVSKHPSLVTIVKEKRHTWQDLYEVYDLYGTDEKLWDNYLSNSKKEVASDVDVTTSLGELAKVFKNINIDNVQKYIDTAQKAIGVIQELTGKSSASTISKVGPQTARPINKIFED